ncbi:LysR family transcriptional regulator [Stenotrophomonas sp. S41]|uniref:LysR family transcriptional regulator n=1 Tax=Stenotrophomonas sp. S41 TaxID=2767464 RepID=UPI00190A80AB|nr:LysR family transcriptional regulator [Stenotrophomonas sp. S41]MBK0011702.1 LysR family transcriptional regulator [Stenotrophomonas sp. S41]
MDRLLKMEVLIAVAESGSFAAAATRLGMSPQMVAKHVQGLESKLGVRLINRTTRRQSLTEFGERYLERSRKIVADADAADALAGEAMAEPKGRIRISAPVNFGAGAFMGFLNEYLLEYPRVDIEVILAERAVDLVDEGFEAVFRVGALSLVDSSTLVARPLKPMQLILCASPRYLAKAQLLQHPSDLAQHNCICYVFSDGQPEVVWRFKGEGEEIGIRVSGNLKVNDMNSMISAGLSGAGIILAKEDAVADALSSGTLVRVLPSYEGPQIPMRLIYRRDRQMTAKLRTFVDKAVKTFGE